VLEFGVSLYPPDPNKSAVEGAIVAGWLRSSPFCNVVWLKSTLVQLKGMKALHNKDLKPLVLRICAL